MSILEEIEADKKALAELEEQESKETQEPEDQPEEEDDGNSEEKPTEEDAGDEQPDDGAGEEGSEDDEGEELSDEDKERAKKEEDSRFARLRREKAAAEKRAQELEERLNSQNQAKDSEDKKEVAGEPDIQKDPIAWLEWNKQRVDNLEKQLSEKNAHDEELATYNEAKNHFMAIEQEFSKNIDDYEDVSSFMASQIANSIKVLNPHISPQELAQRTEREILSRGANYFAKGLNPAEELYYEAKEVFGYQPPQKENNASEKPLRPDMAKVAKNRKRNAGTAGVASSGGRPQISREEAANMTTAEWSKLPKEEKQRLLQG